jgi:hypothetical protein
MGPNPSDAPNPVALIAGGNPAESTAGAQFASCGFTLPVVLAEPLC